VLTTTRFPLDAAQRYAREDDFSVWQNRLEIVGPVELSNMRLVERFCDQMIARFPRIHVLINNAAQTITRPEGWYYRMLQLENTADASLSPEARALVKTPADLQRLTQDTTDVAEPAAEQTPSPAATETTHADSGASCPPSAVPQQAADNTSSNRWISRLSTAGTSDWATFQRWS